MDQVVVDAIALNDLTNLNRSETEATAHACQRPEAQTCEAMGPDSHDNVEKNSVVISETMFSCATPPKTLAMEDSEFITAAFAEKPSTEDDFNNALPSPPDSLEPHSPTSPVVEKPTDKPTMIPLKRIPDEIVPSETLPRESSPPSKKYKLRSNTSVADTGEALSCTSTESNVSELIDETASPRSHLRQATHMDQNRVQSWHTKTVHDPAEIDPSATRTQSDNRQPPTAPSEAFLRRSSRNTSVSTNPVIQSSAQPISSTKTTSIETQAEKSRKLLI
ncbi:uncharacterized protein BYT42DRAFT_238471 [Radiomyces spectabilis]|uniref:uncharacterized protein n=1 Tax=Radiomyces spectabilis TaxID=64574 RepID=UPI00221F5C59|nr:uncharacterized protein BYT42DRAFT_238471 [Radiomyces spectabilis]KAI8388530.1 hypothetical protein BYT42DRAFT_238471 [Radiomyces spectabilis]